MLWQWFPNCVLCHPRPLRQTHRVQWDVPANRAVVPKHTEVMAPFFCDIFFLASLGTIILDHASSHVIQDGGTRERQEEEAVMKEEFCDPGMFGNHCPIGCFTDMWIPLSDRNLN